MADLEGILYEAQHRWLRPPEVCVVLRNYQKFQLTPEPPFKPPGNRFPSFNPVTDLFVNHPFLFIVCPSAYLMRHVEIALVQYIPHT